MSRKLLSGKGAQYNPSNSFANTEIELSDEELHHRGKPSVRVYLERPKSILSKNSSEDLHFDYSVNPYQGCEHGCSYCYARVTHEYWGYSAGLDFETQLMVKPNAPELLRKQLSSPKWKGALIMFSGNTDCYQPIEKKYELTRALLAICLEHKQAVHIITKNHLILRDLDILSELAKLRLVEVCVSITTLDEKLRRQLEPRTSTSTKRFETVRTLTDQGIPTSVNIAPVIPGLNQVDLPGIIKKSAEAGAYNVNYATVRLNGKTAAVFADWLETHYPERKEKVWHGIERLHDGKVGESRFKMRMRGKGPEATAINQLFHQVKKKYFPEVKKPQLDYSLFTRSSQPTLF